MNVASPRIVDQASKDSWLRMVRAVGAVMALSFLHLISLILSYGLTAYIFSPMRTQSEFLGLIHMLGFIMTTVLMSPLVYLEIKSPVVPVGLGLLNSLVWGVGLYLAIKWFVRYRYRGNGDRRQPSP